jgi:hypothetical protein
MRSVGPTTLVVLGLLAGCDGFGASDDPSNPGGIGGPGTVNGTASGGGFTIKKVDGTVFLIQEATVTIPIAIERGPLQTNDVVVTIAPLPAGVSATPLTLTGTATTGEITLTATPNATQGLVDVIIKGDALGIKASTGLGLFVRGKSGTVDPTFGDSGRRILPGINHQSVAPRGRVLVKDDKLFVVSDCPSAEGVLKSCAARMSVAAGTIDATYGDGRFPAQPRALALDSGGRVLVGGGLPEGVVARGDVNGKLDLSFGGTGTLQVQRSVDALAVSPTDEVYFAYRYDSGGAAPAGEARIDHVSASGQAVAGFGDRGGYNLLHWERRSNNFVTGLFFRTAPSGASAVFALGVFTQLPQAPYGGFGTAHVGAGGPVAALRPLPINENLSASYSSSVRLTNGSMVTFATASANQQLFLKVDPDGNPDPSWDTDGLSVLGTGAQCRGIGAGLEGHVYCALDGAGDRIVRLTPNGKLDTAWGFNGILSLAYAAGAVVADLHVQPDGRILLLSSAVLAGTTTFYITRIWH